MVNYVNESDVFGKENVYMIARKLYCTASLATCSNPCLFIIADQT